MSRIPKLTDDSNLTMLNWWYQMAAAGLAFHPDDDPAEVIDSATGAPLFTPEELVEVRAATERMSIACGDLIYEAALLASEPPAHTSARESAIMRDDWHRDDIEITPFAAIEEVSGGYWVEARVFVHGE